MASTAVMHGEQQIVKDVWPMVLWAPQALLCLRNPLMWLDISGMGLLYCHVAYVD